MDGPIPEAPRKVDPQSLTLRVSPRPVMRLSRRMLAVLTGVLAFAVLGATIWSLQSGHRKRGMNPVELYNVDRVTRSEALEQLPSDYSKVPRPVLPPEVPVLGEPLPGDLAGPILKQQGREPYKDSAEAERLARLNEAEEAANSSVFFRNGGAQRHVAAQLALDSPQPNPADSNQPFDPLATGPASVAATDPTAIQNRQEQKLAFMTQGESGPGRNTGQLQPPGSPYQVMAGTLIPAALVTGLDSDLPGQVIATVTEAVYDTATGRHLLIPQGSRLIGRYDSQVAFGQRRVLLVWTRLILPDASSIALDKLPGIDTAGYAGLEDGVDWHWDRILAGAALSTLLGIGAELAMPQDLNEVNSAIIAGRESVQDTTNEIGQEITRRNLNIQPTLTVRPGFPMRVMVNKDLILRPYQPLFFQRGAFQ